MLDYVRVTNFCIIIISTCMGGARVLVVKHWTCDHLGHGFVAICVTTLGMLFTPVPLSPSSTTWYRLNDGDVLRLGRWPQAWRKVMAPYHWGWLKKLPVGIYILRNCVMRKILRRIAVRKEPDWLSAKPRFCRGERLNKMWKITVDSWMPEWLFK